MSTDSDGIERECETLRGYAVIAADFYRALVDQGFPADGATRLCEVWLDHSLQPAEEEVDDG